MTSAARDSRGAATRERIVSAALYLIGEVGAAELDHRMLASAAGVSLARTTYYFASRTEIIRAAYELLVQQDAEQLAARIASAAGENTALGDALAAAVELMTDDLGACRKRTLAWLELALEAGRDVQAQPTFDALLSGRINYFSHVLGIDGRSAPLVRARLFVSGYLGIVLRFASTSEEVPPREVLQSRLDRLLSLTTQVAE